MEIKSKILQYTMYTNVKLVCTLAEIAELKRAYDLQQTVTLPGIPEQQFKIVSWSFSAVRKHIKGPLEELGQRVKQEDSPDDLMLLANLELRAWYEETENVR